MEVYLINEVDSAKVFLPLLKYKDNIELIKCGTFNTLFKIKVFGTAQELEPIKKVCRMYHATLEPVVEKNEEEVEEEVNNEAEENE